MFYLNLSKKYNNQEIHLYSSRILNNLNATLKRNVVTGNFFKPYQNLVAKQGSINGVQIRTHVHIRTMLSGVIKTSSKFSPALRYSSSQKSTLMKQKSDVHLVSNRVTVPQRSMVIARGGKLKTKELSKEQKPTQSDTTGTHKISVIIGCENHGCKNTNCIKGTNDTNPCKVSGDIHKKPLKEVANDLEKAGFFMEISGALTHKIPPAKKGTFVSPADLEKKPKIQYVVQEKKSTEIPFTALKENEKVSAYCQEDRHTASLVRNLPQDSKLNIKDKESTSIGQQTKKPFESIPKDEGF